MVEKVLRHGPAAPLGAFLAVLALAPAGCGDGSEEPASTAPMPAEAPETFPAADGKTIDGLRGEVGSGGPVLAPAVFVLEPGKNRFGFGIFDRARRQIAEAPAALYVARAGGGRARGPFAARYESLEVKPEFHSQSVVKDPDAAKSVYVADLAFRRPGRYVVLALVRLDERLAATEPVEVQVTAESPVPSVGERAPRIETPTRRSAGSIDEIETRVPPDTMHEVNYAGAHGQRPIVIVFATPALCESRVCGPVVDVAEQVKSEHDGDAAFIHMEIYRDNEMEKGFRPQVSAFNLPTEPWAFAIDRSGTIAARLEGAFSVRELKRTVAKAEL